MLQLHFAGGSTKYFEKQIRPDIDKVRMVCCFLYQCMKITSIFNFCVLYQLVWLPRKSVGGQQ